MVKTSDVDQLLSNYGKVAFTFNAPIVRNLSVSKDPAKLGAQFQAN